MTVRPILIPFEDYERQPKKEIIEKYSDGYTNILFVGRIAPNKKHQDVIRAFAHYKKYINKRSRLIFVGSDKGTEKYSECIRKYAQELGLDDIVFAGHTGFDSLLAYYRVADVFLCMSEHEGFCVPLVEAMYFDVPIIAYDSSAIADTLGGSGVLLKDKEPVLAAKIIARITEDNLFREALIRGQRKRLGDFSYENVKNIFISQLNDFIKKQESSVK